MNWLNLDQIEECLRELSDRQLQEALWTGKIPSQQSTFTEAVEGLFTDSGLNDALRSGKSNFSAEVKAKLLELEHYLSIVSSKGGTADVINDPTMDRVRDLASSALKLLSQEKAVTDFPDTV